MRKAIALLLLVGLLAAFEASPAMAGKKKTGEFIATGVPAADLCPSEAVETVHKKSEPFKAPAAGVLTFGLKVAPVGDWDIYALTPDGGELGSSVGSVGAQDIVTVELAKKQEILMVACNWAGEPTVTINWTFTYTK